MYSITCSLVQGSYGSWKTWKVLEFYYGRPLVLESSRNLLNSAKKYEVYERQ